MNLIKLNKLLNTKDNYTSQIKLTKILNKIIKTLQIVIKKIIVTKEIVKILIHSKLIKKQISLKKTTYSITCQTKIEIQNQVSLTKCLYNKLSEIQINKAIPKTSILKNRTAFLYNHNKIKLIITIL